ncbi:MAG: hypothetical protein JEZ00_13435 [Anaerolineaceae bacterium]|nr:hypothetical protein [Anaerolineaceae bacterium]
MKKKTFSSQWLMPPRINEIYRNAQKLLRCKYSMFLQRDTLPDFSTIRQLKDIHKGERCFVLATGPSLGKMDLKKLKGEKIIAIHDSWLHPDFDIIRPQYHTIAPYHIPFTFDDIEKRLKGIHDTYRWPMKLFLGFTFYPLSVNNFLCTHPEFQFSETYQINYSYGQELQAHNYLRESIWDITKKPFSPLTGNMQALQIGLHMGFSEIVFLGIDHTFARKLSPTGNPHFYSKHVGQDDGIQYQHNFDREQIFARLSRLWTYYRYIREYSERKGIKVLNATPGSELDVLETISLDEYLK